MKIFERPFAWIITLLDTPIRCTATCKHIYSWAVLKHGYSMQFSSKNILQGLLFALCLNIGVCALELTLPTEPADEGADVQIKCQFTVTTTTQTVSINHTNTVKNHTTTTVLWQYRNRKGNVSEAYKDRIKSTSVSGYTKDVTITLTNVTIADNGSYGCVVEEGGHIEGWKDASLTVHVPPRSMRVFVSSPPPYKDGETYNVSCTFTVYPSVLTRQVIIKRGTGTFTAMAYSTENGGMHDVTLYHVFKLLKADNEKLPFSCEVTWSRTKYSVKQENPLNITYQTSSDVRMNSPPVSPISEGDLFSITCQDNNANNPPITIDWKVGNNNVTEGIEVSYKDGTLNGQMTFSTLWVSAKRWMNGTNITCCHETKCKHHKMDVIFPPTINTMSVNVSYHENGTVGSIVNITCTRDASNPVAKIEWDVPDKQVTKLLPEPLNRELEDENGDKYITSFFYFEVKEENFTQPITCGVKWNGVLFIALNKSFILGDEMTTAVPSESTSTSTYPYIAGVTEDEQKQTTAGVVMGASQASSAAGPLTTAVIIGIALGVGCGVLLVTVIILVVVLVRRRKVRSNDIDAKDTDQEKRLSAHVYDDIDEASGDGNVSKQDHLDGLYDEIQQDNSNTQLPKDNLKDKPATTTNGPVTSLPTTGPTPSLDTPDANGVVYAVVSKPVKTPTGSAPEAQKSKANSISSVLDTDVPEESKAIKVSAAKGSPPDLNTHKMDKSVNEKKDTATEEKEAHSPRPVSGKEPVAVTSESNKKKGKPKKPPKKPKPSTGKSQEKQKEKPAHSKKKGSKSNDETIHSDENVYYNTLDVVLNGSSPGPKELVPERPQKRMESKNKSSKVDDTPREYYNTCTRDEILHKPPVIDDAYCEISTEPPSSIVKDHGADYAEVSDNLDTSARSVSSKHRSSYHTVDFAQSDGGDDDGASGGEDIDSD